MCAKLFKVEVIRSHLIYQEEGTGEYHLDDDLRQLSYYSIRDEGMILVAEK